MNVFRSSHVVAWAVFLNMLIIVTGFSEENLSLEELPSSAVYTVYPVAEARSVGSVQRRLISNTVSWGHSTPLAIVGYRSVLDGDWKYWYRSHAKFDLTTLPSNICIDSVSLAGVCIDTSENPSQILRVHKMSINPMSYSTDQELYEAIVAAPKYDSCFNCTQQLGQHLIPLGPQAVTQLTNNLLQGWTAIGLTSNVDGWEHAQWDSLSLEIYAHDLSVGPHAPVATDTLPCAGETYTVYWAPDPSATGYRLYENSSLIYSGTSAQTQLSHSTGSFNYTVSYNTVCGWSAQSSSSSVTILTTSAIPFPPSATDSTPCTGQSYTVAWDSVFGPPGGVAYRLFEDGVQIYQGPALQQTLNKAQPAVYTYSVQPGNTCGWYPVSGITVVSVISAPATPAAPISNLSEPCDADPYTISWNDDPNATLYRLYEDGILAYEGVDTSMIFSYPPEIHTYHVASGNSCGWSAAGPTTTVAIEQPPGTPTAPSVSPANPCTNTMYSVNWPSVSGATDYQLYENGILIYQGANNSTQLSQPSSGTFNYYVAAGTDCGVWSGPSDSSQIVIQSLPAAPGTPIVPWSTPCAKDSFPVFWNTVPGATSYIIDLNGNPAQPVADTSIWVAFGSDGTYRIWVTAVNNCGESAMSDFVVILVGGAPVPPDTLYNATADTVDIDQPYSLKAVKHEFAAAYNLYENGVFVQSFPAQEFDFTTSQSVPGDYNYTLAICTECACSDTVANLLVVVRGPATCCIGNTGNIDGDPGDLTDISDLTYVVNYIFGGGPPPVCFDESDLTLDGATDISDLTFIVDYIFGGGVAPPPCP